MAGGHASGAPFIVCKSEDIPLRIDTAGNRHLRDLNNTVLLSPSKDAIVPTVENIQNVNVPQGINVPRERNHKGGPYILCKSEDIPRKIETGNRDLKDLLNPSKDAIVPSGAAMGRNSKNYQVTYGQTILTYTTSGGI